MQVTLVIEKGNTRTQQVVLRSPQTVIGRQRGSGLRIPSSRVSRQHCRLSVENGYLTVEDLESVNGTFLNGEPVNGRLVVRPGDRLDVGPVTFRVEYQAAPGSLEAAAPTPGVLAGGSEELDVLPLADEDVDTDQAEPLEALDDLEAVPEAEPLAEADEPLPMLDAAEAEPEAETEDVASFHLPESEELRSLLAGMEEGSPPTVEHRRKRRR